MPGRRIEMRKLKEVLRLRLTARLSNRKIALCTGVGKSAVSKHVGRAEELGLDWPRIESMAEEAVEALLYPPSEEPRCSARPLRSAPSTTQSKPDSDRAHANSLDWLAPASPPADPNRRGTNPRPPQTVDQPVLTTKMRRCCR